MNYYPIYYVNRSSTSLNHLFQSAQIMFNTSNSDKKFPLDLTFEFFEGILKWITPRDCFQIIRFIDLSFAIKWRKPGDYSLLLSENWMVQLKLTNFLGIEIRIV